MNRTHSHAMNIHLISLMPEMFTALTTGVTGRFLQSEHITLHHHNPRTFTTDRYHKVDDKPFGGGPGMLMQAEPIYQCMQHINQLDDQPNHTVLLSASGPLATQKTIQRLAQYPKITFICGRYEGIDHRITPHINESLSIGSYVLSGGELGAMVLIDAICRQRPGALGNTLSAVDDSYSDQLIEHPQYTRPREWRGQQTPETLLSGHTQRINTWKTQHALGNTWWHHPELLIGKIFTAEEQQLLQTYINNQPIEESS